MKGKKRRVYASSWTPVQRIDSSGHETFTSMVSQGRFLTKRTKNRPPDANVSIASKVHEQLSYDLKPSVKKKLIEKTKKSLVKVAVILSLTNWVATWVGYNLIRSDGGEFDTSETIVLKSIIFLLSTVQCFLLISHWMLRTTFYRTLQSVLNIRHKNIRKFRQNPIAQFKCGVECLLHLLIPLPGYSITLSTIAFGSPLQVNLNDGLFLVILLRNYHTFRALYWLSELSTMRMSHFFALRGRQPYFSLVIKYYLARYSLIFILGAYGIMVLLCGLLQYTLEHRASEMISRVWNGMWVVAYTQTTIGYGDTVPKSVLGQAGNVGSCLFGILVLGMLNSTCGSNMSLTSSQLKMFNFLVHSREKWLYRRVSIVLLQRWWRLIINRKKSDGRGQYVLLFFSQMTFHRGTTLKCRGIVKDNSFQGQIEEFGEELGKKVARTIEYLRPIVPFQDVVRGQTGCGCVQDAV